MGDPNNFHDACTFGKRAASPSTILRSSQTEEPLCEEMNHCVPDFDVEDDFSLPTSSELTRPKKSSMAMDEVMELLWQNGHVVMHSQNQRSVRKSPPSKFNDVTNPPEQSSVREIREENLFVQEDEMASWFHYPLVDDSPLYNAFCAELYYSTPPQCNSHYTTSNASVRRSQGIEFRPSAAGMASRPPITSIRKTYSDPKEHNLVYLAGHASMVESGSSSKKSVVRDSTMVDSDNRPLVGPESKASMVFRETVTEPSKNGDLGCEIITSCLPAGTSAGVGVGHAGKETMTCEVTVTSSPGDSSASAEPTTEKLVFDDRKRKGREADVTECHSEDVDFESGDAKKQVGGSISNKRSRAAEVHNLSERRRRDRINEKMKALQDLIPRCNKSDKASMLDEAIEYLKSLQLQVQMMSMGCGMMPMMFPGHQSYMLPIGMGMGMEMGLNRPMMPFPNMLPGHVLPTPTGASHIAPRFPMPAFHMPIPLRTDQSRQPDHGLDTLGTQALNQPRVPSFLEAYPYFLAPHQMQMSQSPIPQQKQSVTQSSPSRQENLENHLSG